MTLSAEDITKLIKKKLPDAIIEIKDIRGDNNHYHAKVISSTFKGLSKLKQHKNYLHYNFG